MDFHIDEAYLCSVDVVTEYSLYSSKPHTELTPEQLIEVIRGTDIYKCQSTMDHPEFTKLRESLEEQGYIKIERRWWNGDKVLKPFTLNGFKFKKNSQFSSASAIAVSFTLARKHNKKILY